MRAARALVGWTQRALADRAKVRVETIRRMESFGHARIGCTARSLERVTRVLRAAGIEFLDGGEPGIRLRSR